MSTHEEKELLLSNLRVLDLTDDKGYLCGSILGDLGADVIKLEPPGGDPGRNMGPFYRDIPHPEKSLYWFAYNRNKRGITLNLHAIDGKEIFHQLVKGSDIVIESFSPGYMDNLGLGYSVLNDINPRIIMTSITPFGQEGPYRHFKAYNIILMAMGGLMYLTGDRDRPPVQFSFPQAYLHAAAEAALGTMIAYYYRQMTGEGQWVDISVQESVSITPLSALWYWDTYQENLERAGPCRVGLSTRGQQQQVWKCKDGYVCFTLIGGVLAASSTRGLIGWMESEGMAPDFLKQKDWEAFDLATTSQAELDQLLEPIGEFFLQHTKAEIYEEAINRRFILGPVSTASDVVGDPQLLARDYWQQMEHPELGVAITYPGDFIKLSETPSQLRRRAPLIGEHNEEIYGKELGFSNRKQAMLKQAGVI